MEQVRFELDKDIARQLGVESVSTVKELRQALPKEMTLRQVLQNAKYQAPPMDAHFEQRSVPTAEYRERIAKLKKLDEQRKYDLMVSNISAGRGHLTREVALNRDVEPLSSYGTQLSAGLNVLVTMLTLAAVGYFAGAEAFPDDPNIKYYGAIAGVIVGIIIDTILFIASCYRLDKEAIRKEKARTRM